MVREFRIVLATPPLNQGEVKRHISVNSDVTGHVLLVLDRPLPGFKAVEVSLKGRAKVRRTRDSSNDSRTVIESHEDYITNTAVLWSEEHVPDGRIPAGSHQFSFSLRFQPDGPLPPSLQRRLGNIVGNIVYEVEAVIVKKVSTGFNVLKNAANITTSIELLYSSVVDPSLTPEVLEPKILQVQRSLYFLCCSSGSISLTARIPRSGFSVGVGDAIPLEVDVENGSSRLIQLRANLIKSVTYFVGGCRFHDQLRIFLLANSDLIQPGSSLSWRPPPLSIPDTEPSITNCKIITLDYILKINVLASAFETPPVKFNLLLGNVPVDGSQPLPPSAPEADPSTLYPQLAEPSVEASYQQPGSIPSSSAAPLPPAAGLPPGFVDPIKR